MSVYEGGPGGTLPPVRIGTARPQDASRRPLGSLAAAGRLVRLEVRRNVVRWLLPLMAVLFWFDTYRTGAGYPPLWGLRTEDLILHHALPDLVPFAAGAAAWTGARDSRRHTVDLVATTAWPGWARRGAALAGVTGWVLAVYAGCVAVVFASTAVHATWGGPPLWPVVTGAAEVTAVCAVAFTAGWFFASPFTVPMTTLGTFIVQLLGFKFADNSASPYALLSPTTHVPPIDTGVFYPYLPDLSMAQTMFLAGLAVAAFGVLGLPGVPSGGWVRRVAAAVAVAGLAASGAAVGLAGTARQGAQGVVIPALHDAASDQAVTYTPVCRPAAGIPVCVHPAFETYLRDVTAALGPVLGEVADLPGAPVRVTQAPTGCVLLTFERCGFGAPAAAISGNPPVFTVTIPATPGWLGADLAGFEQQTQTAVVVAVVGGRMAPGAGIAADPAQQAVYAALLRAAGVPVITPAQGQAGTEGVAGPPPGSPAYLAFRRFAALSPAVRHAWLAEHLAALRAGHVTLEELP